MHSKWIILMGVWLSGCAFVTQSDKEAKICTLDEDGDGDPKCGDCGTPECGDCDDDNPSEYNGGEEIPYDGWDNDCADGQDLVDVDGDGFPGVHKDDFDAANDQGKWPADAIVTPPAGFTTYVDCDDTVASTYPASSADVPYDGVDSDCAEDDDFDFDGDGYAYVPAGGVAYTGTLPTGDCDDTDADVNPGQSVDAWYDGVDSDCAGNNDFDQDGDGFVPSGYGFEYDQFLEAYADLGYDFGEYAAIEGDCLDVADALLPTADPAAVNPAATETWYDGIDADCLGDNDFDQDADGYRPDGYDMLAETFCTVYFGEEASWPANCGDEANGDCEDTDDTVNPVALEKLQDSVDQDCNGSNETAWFAFGDYEWAEVRAPAVGGDDNRYFLSVMATQYSYLETTQQEAGVELVFLKDSGNQAVPESQQVWTVGSAGADPVGGGFDMVLDGDTHYLAYSYKVSSKIHLKIKRYTWDSVLAGYSSLSSDYEDEASLITVAANYDDVDLRLADDGTLWVLGCTEDDDDDLLQAVTIDTTGDLETQLDVSESLAGGSGDLCFTDLSGSTARHVAQGSSAQSTYSVNAADEFEGTVSGWSDYDLTAVRTHGDLVIGVDDDDLVVLHHPTLGFREIDLTTELGSGDIVSADAMFHDGTLYGVGVLDPSTTALDNKVFLVYGDISSGSFSVTDFDFVSADGEAFTPEHASLHVDEDRLVIAVSGDNAVGWMFLEMP